MTDDAAVLLDKIIVWLAVAGLLALAVGWVA
jgi:hypothetical protein